MRWTLLWLMSGCSLACGSTEPEEPVITTLEEAQKVNVGAFAAGAGLEFEVVSYVKEDSQETTVTRAEGVCPGGSGTVLIESTNKVMPDGADFVSTFTYHDCVVSDELTLNGQITSRTVQAADKRWTGTRTGTLETTLGVCVFEIALEGEGEIAALSEEGMLCGIEYEN